MFNRIKDRLTAAIHSTMQAGEEAEQKRLARKMASSQEVYREALQHEPITAVAAQAAVNSLPHGPINQVLDAVLLLTATAGVATSTVTGAALPIVILGAVVKNQALNDDGEVAELVVKRPVRAYRIRKHNKAQVAKGTQVLGVKA